MHTSTLQPDRLCNVCGKPVTVCRMELNLAAAPTPEKGTEAADPGAGEITPPHRQGAISLQGWPVIQQLAGAVYVRIPKELQRECGGCSCAYCVSHPDETPMWDTLGVPLGDARSPMTWTLHAPEWGRK